jgi:hypothetical protein
MNGSFTTCAGQVPTVKHVTMIFDRAHGNERAQLASIFHGRKCDRFPRTTVISSFDERLDEGPRINHLQDYFIRWEAISKGEITTNALSPLPSHTLCFVVRTLSGTTTNGVSNV